MGKREDMAREAQRNYMRAYMREWRKKNPDKVREMKERYWAKKGQQLRESEEEERETATN